MTIVLSILLLLYTFIISYLIAAVVRGLRITNNPESLVDSVSIVIPFRNEEDNLPTLIASLEKQSYPGILELLLINDNSEDGSVKVAKQCTRKTRFQTKIIDLHLDQNRNLTSKQQAIDLGIRSAANNLIILTDADMTFDSEWITMLVTRMHSDSQPVLAFGHTSIYPINNVFERFQAFQLEFLFSIAYAFHLGGITGSCMGNNIIVSRNNYIESGGFDATGYSIVEDRALFALFSKQKKKITFTNPFFPSAYTPAVSSFQQFSQQMLRWARGGFTLNSNLILPAILLTVQMITFFCFFSLPRIPALLTALNTALTWLFIWITFGRTRTTISPWLFPPWVLFLLFEVGIFLHALIFRKKIVWKGRNI